MNISNFCHISLIRLALPNFFATLSVPLLGIVDIALAGHMSRVEDLSALALSTILFQLLYWFFGFLRMGTTGSTAQTQADGIFSPASIRILCNSSLLALLISGILIIFQKPIFLTYYYFAGGDALTSQLSYSYSEIRIWAAPATLLNFVIHGWYLGIQNPWIPLFLNIIIQITNIFLNILFTQGFGMAVQGLATATVIAQWLGLLLALVDLHRRKKIGLNELQINFKGMLDLLQTNVDLMIRTLFLMLSIHSVSWLAARLGPLELAASAIVLQVLGLLSYGLDGIALACESLIGQAVGQKNKRHLWQIIRTGFFWSFLCSLICTVVFWLAISDIMTCFTDKSEVINLCEEWKHFLVIAPGISFACFVWDGIYIGAMRTRAMRNSMLVSSLMIYLPSVFILFPKIQMSGLWISYLLFMTARGVTLTLLASKEMNEAITKTAKSDSREAAI